MIQCDPKMIQNITIVTINIESEKERELFEIIKRSPSISRAKLSKLLNISERQVRKIIENLRNKGILTREGGRSGKWIIKKL